MYKIITQIETKFLSGIVKENSVIPLDPANSDYQQFIQDVAEQGIEIVEGPDIVEPDYATLRQQEYPSYADQFDQIYHEGVDAWKADIQEIKDKYPKTITGGTTIGPVPDWVQEAADNWTFNKQLNEYVTAVERLSQVILLEGREEISEIVTVGTEEVFNEETGEVETVNITEIVITQTAIEPLEEFVEVTITDPETLEETTETIRNPLVVKDEEERAAAQAVVDATPQAVIDAINS